MPVCVGPVRKPHCWFSHEAAHLFIADITSSFSLLTFIFFNFLQITEFAIKTKHTAVLLYARLALS